MKTDSLILNCIGKYIGPKKVKVIYKKKVSGFALLDFTLATKLQKSKPCGTGLRKNIYIHGMELILLK